MYALYTDDSILGALTRKELDAAIKAIQAAKLHITFEGDLTDFLGVKKEQKNTKEIIFSNPISSMTSPMISGSNMRRMATKLPQLQAKS